MSHDSEDILSGEVTEIFAHRFVIKTAKGKVLADLGPRGAEQVVLKEGDRVTIAGEMKTSEMKVSRIEKQGGRPVEIEHKKKPHDGKPDPDADPEIAMHAAREAGFTVLGEPKRRPKHFEILGRKAEGDFAELHIELDGRLRRAKPVAPEDHKWAAEIGAAH